MDYEKLGQIRSFESYVDQSSCYSHFEMELPSLPFVPPADHLAVADLRGTDDEVARSASHDVDESGTASHDAEGLHKPADAVRESSSSMYSFSSADLSSYFFGSKSSRSKSSARAQRSDTVTSSTAVSSGSGPSGGSGGGVVGGAGGGNIGAGLKVPLRSPLTRTGSFKIFASSETALEEHADTHHSSIDGASGTTFDNNKLTPTPSSPPLSPDSYRRLSDTVQAIFPTDSASSESGSNKLIDSPGKVRDTVQIDSSVLLDLDAWLILMSQKAGRAFLIARLDERRSSNATLTSAQYEYLLCALHACLDQCMAQDDVQAAMRVANMANTFHIIG